MLPRSAGSKPPEALRQAQNALRRLDDVLQARRDPEIAQRIGRKPEVVVEFLVQLRLARAPARRKRQDHIMSGSFARRHDFAPGGEASNVDLQRGFFSDLAMQGGVKGFAEFDAAAGQRIKTLRR